MPWPQAVELLLAHVGAGYQTGDDGRIVVMDMSRLPLTSEDFLDRATSDFDAAAGDRSDARSAEGDGQSSRTRPPGRPQFSGLVSHLTR